MRGNKMKPFYIVSKDIRSEEVNNYIKRHHPQFLKEKYPDLILVSGGDGAMLHAIQSHGDLNVPFLGYATGTLNFLMNEIDLVDLPKIIEGIKKDNLSLNEIVTSKIRVELFSKKSDKRTFLGNAVNEVVIGTTIMGYHEFILNSLDKTFVNFDIKGSGLSISTDLGSTGYNFNLGGAVLPLGSNLWSVLGVVCNRYLEDIVEINELKIACECKNMPPTLYLDGIDKKIVLCKGDEIVLTKGGSVTLYFLNKEVFQTKRLEIISRYRR